MKEDIGYNLRVVRKHRPHGWQERGSMVHSSEGSPMEPAQYLPTGSGAGVGEDTA